LATLRAMRLLRVRLLFVTLLARRLRPGALRRLRLCGWQPVSHVEGVPVTGCFRCDVCGAAVMGTRASTPATCDAGLRRLRIDWRNPDDPAWKSWIRGGRRR
jgi:hypothetical protein